MESPAANLSDEQKFLDLLCQGFKKSITRSAIWVFQENFDTHDVASAKDQPKRFAGAVGRMAQIFQTLSDTAFDAKRSMLDVTTIMMATEFSRSMRVQGEAIDNTGTNNNQLTNSVLLGGKGIRGGLVLGGSDFQTAGESLNKVHQTFDHNSIQIVARPFDFTTRQVRPNTPEILDLRDYLTIGSVINTVYATFGVSPDRYRKLGRNLPVAPLLSALI